ncbi:MAG: caspase family protein [Cyanobacteria bacterium J06554_6]
MTRDALIVGINQYQALPELRAPAADAQAVATLLQDRGEFKTRRMPEVVDSANHLVVGQQTPVTTAELQAALIALLKPEGIVSASTVLFYFSGHGLQRAAGVREGFLATSDTRPEAGGISLNWLRRLIDDSPVKQIIVILDCCHSGELFNVDEANPTKKEGCNRLFIAASRAYEAAYESLDSDYSVLTQAVLSGLNPHRVDSGKISNHSLVSWVSEQLRSESQQPVIEHSGSEFLLTRAEGVMQPPPRTPLSTLSRLRRMTFAFCPYRGLEPFCEKHADYFFGRDDLTHTLLNHVRSSNFCAVVGASSSGKTSLLRAGLIYQLQQGQQISGSETWTVKYLTPGQRPLRSLASIFIDPEASDIERAAQLNRAEALLQESDSGLAQLVAATRLQSQRGNDHRFLLIIDQLEEIIRTTEIPQINAERHQFVRCLLTALEDISLPLGLVIGLRTDAMDDLLDFPELFRKMEDNIVTMTSIPYRQLREVITKPAEKVNLHIDSQLLNTLMMDLTGAPGELTLVQQTLLELWRRREISAVSNGPRLTTEAYAAIGGVKKVLINRASAVYEGFTVEEKKAAERIFLSLCELGDGQEDSKRRAYKSELINETYPAELMNRTLEKLVAARLVIVDQESTTDLCTGGISVPGAAWQTQASPTAEIRRWFIKNSPLPAANPETVEIAHKSLIQDWPLLRHWLHSHRDWLRYRRRLEEHAQEWCQRNRPLHSEYLLVGRRLQEARSFSAHYGQELSGLAQELVTASRRAQLRQRLRRGALALLVPLALAAGMTVSFFRNRLPKSWQPSSQVRPEQVIKPDSPQREQGQPLLAVSQSVAAISAMSPALPTLPMRIASTPRPAASAPSALAESYVVESVRQMPSPQDPEQMVEVWVVRQQEVTVSQGQPAP